MTTPAHNVFEPAALRPEQCPDIGRVITTATADAGADGKAVEVTASVDGAGGVAYHAAITIPWTEIADDPGIVKAAVERCSMLAVRDARTGHQPGKNLPTMIGCPSHIHAEFNGRILFREYQRQVDISARLRQAFGVEVFPK